MLAVLGKKISQAKDEILCLALGSIIKCYTTLGKNLRVGPPVTLIMECPLGNGLALALVEACGYQ